jgi:hypothetical protein
LVFTSQGDESDEGQEEEKGVEEENEPANQNDNIWGITPLILEVSQKTMTPIQQVYDFAVTEFFFYASYLIDENQKKLAEMKKLSKKP